LSENNAAHLGTTPHATVAHGDKKRAKRKQKKKGVEDVPRKVRLKTKREKRDQERTSSIFIERFLFLVISSFFLSSCLMRSCIYLPLAIRGTHVSRRPFLFFFEGA
jgi:hypothetical protein